MAGINHAVLASGKRLEIHVAWIWAILVVGTPFLQGPIFGWAAAIMVGVIVVLLRSPRISKLCEAPVAKCEEWFMRVLSIEEPEPGRLNQTKAKILGGAIHCTIYGFSSLTGIHGRGFVFLASFAIYFIGLFANCYLVCTDIHFALYAVWFAIGMYLTLITWYFTPFGPEFFLMGGIAVLTQSMLVYGTLTHPAIRRSPRLNSYP
jgi:hypothetical protein